MNNDSLHIIDTVPATLGHNGNEKSILKTYSSEYSASSDIHPKIIRNQNLDWMFFIILTGYIIYTLINVFNRKRLTAVVRAFFAKRLVMQISREGNIISDGMSLALFLIFISMFSLLIYLAIGQYFDTQNIKYWGFIYYAEIFFSVLLFLFFKFLIIKISEIIFKTNDISSVYLINYNIFIFFEGLILLPLMTLVVYLSPGYSIYILIGSFILVMIIFLFRLYRGVLIGLSSKNFKLFQLFLYLCTHEIIPLLLIAKLFKDYMV